MWNRLTSAVATNGACGESYTFDNFGNLTGKTPTEGTAPSMTVPANLANNQSTGQLGYDANGIPFYARPANDTWDTENRLVNIGGNVSGLLASGQLKPSQVAGLINQGLCAH